ncbi:MAG: LUD domain-containing protein [Tissierellia bacterium]|nr:LUD domain-containing protein [Tissierellia bacterium]
MDNKLVLVKNSLLKNGFKAHVFSNSQEAKEALLNDIALDESIAFGGSVTLNELDIYDEFKNRGNKIYWHWKAEDKGAALENAINTDIYVCSTNALTLDGKLVNMDGTGNRVASMIFGHKRVYVIVGKNKICRDYNEARERIKNIAAPLNAKRLNINTPCKYTGKCNDCDSPERICQVEVVLHKNPNGTEIIVYIINEDLGY